MSTFADRLLQRLIQFATPLCWNELRTRLPQILTQLHDWGWIRPGETLEPVTLVLLSQVGIQSHPAITDLPFSNLTDTEVLTVLSSVGSLLRPKPDEVWYFRKLVKDQELTLDKLRNLLLDLYVPRISKSVAASFFLAVDSAEIKELTSAAFNHPRLLKLDEAPSISLASILMRNVRQIQAVTATDRTPWHLPPVKLTAGDAAGQNWGNFMTRQEQLFFSRESLVSSPLGRILFCWVYFGEMNCQQILMALPKEWTWRQVSQYFERLCDFVVKALGSKPTQSESR